MRAAILANKDRRVGALLTQPSIWPAESYAKVNVSTAIFRDRRAKSARSRRGNLFPMFASILAPIHTFAAGRDDESLGSLARQNLMHVGVIQTCHGRGPILAFIVAHEQTANFDGSVKTARRLIVGGEKMRAPSSGLGGKLPLTAPRRTPSSSRHSPPLAAL